jgi:hypothetical protein
MMILMMRAQAPFGGLLGLQVPKLAGYSMLAYATQVSNILMYSVLAP